MMRLFILTFLLCGLTVSAVAQEAITTEEMSSRLKAAKAYLELIPVEDEVDDSIEQLVLQVPVKDRVLFRSILEKNINTDDLQAYAEKSLAEVFTADEIIALTEFYKTPEGAQVQKKMPDYQAKLQPYIRDRIMQSMEQFKSHK